MAGDGRTGAGREREGWGRQGTGRLGQAGDGGSWQKTAGSGERV